MFSQLQSVLVMRYSKCHYVLHAQPQVLVPDKLLEQQCYERARIELAV